MYRTIVADPPWPNPFNKTPNPLGPKIKGMWQRGVSTPEAHYPTMSLSEIRSLEIPANKNAYLWLWIPSCHLIRGTGFEVAAAWGFRVITPLQWCKPQIGIGYYLRNAHESALLCIKGSPGPLKDRGIGTWHVWSRSKHSQKPEEFLALVEHLCDGPYLEMFARKRREGWHSWGNEVESDIDIGNQSKCPV